MLADFSVIIPAYNRAELIGETLRTLLNQTVQAKEIIVVDDGSTDGTAEAAEREFLVFREQFSGNSKSNIQHPTFKILRQQNAGPGAARNRGLSEATGQFIHFFDSDDIAAPNKHEVQLRVLLETGADIAYGPWVKGHFAPVEKLKDFLTTIERQGGRENEQPKVGPKGEGVGTTESNDTDTHGYQKNQHGNAPGTCAGDAFSNPSPSELARDSKNTSPTRRASGPGEEALRADDMGSESAGGNQLADSKEFLVGQSQAGLQMDIQKDPTIRAANDPSASGEYSSSVLIRDIRGSKYSLPLNFVPEGPVLQARGLPKGDLVRALLTNWSVVPHACLFRRSILDKAGGFPEDIWVGEDQLLFLRCLLAGAKVVHTPETMVFYRLGNDPGKLTATGAAQNRHARDWARFLLKTSVEVSSAERRGTRVENYISTTKCTNTHEKVEPRMARMGADNPEAQGGAWASQAGASESDSSACELADAPVSESLIRSADAPASSPATSHSSLATAPEALAPATSYSQPVTHRPLACFGFRLRAYEAWRDLEKFFPGEENELKENLERIFLQKQKFRKTETLKYQAVGFLRRKLGGLKQRVLGYREHASFRCGKFLVFGGESGMAANQKN